MKEQSEGSELCPSTTDSTDMPQEWVLWRAALQALAVLTEAQA